MAQFEILTVTFKYIPSDEFKQWFQEQITSRMCGAEVNKNKLIQSTGWYSGDAIAELQEKK